MERRRGRARRNLRRGRRRCRRARGQRRRGGGLRRRSRAHRPSSGRWRGRGWKQSPAYCSSSTAPLASLDAQAEHDNHMARMRLIVIDCLVAACVASRPTLLLAQDTRSSAARPVGNLSEWFPQSSMPAESVVRGQVGAVVIQVGVNAEGTVTDCRVVESSGYRLLDAAACDRAQRVGRFKPARDDGGNPVASRFTLPQIQYVLSKENLSAATVDESRKVYNSTIQVDVDSAGNVEACRSLNADMPSRTACANYVLGKPPPLTSKIPGGSKVTISNTIVVDRTGDR
jgi:TonB family protein